MSAKHWAACVGCILLLALVWPLVSVEIPPVLDYPNHLARAYLLHGGKNVAALAQFYAPRWAVIPNLAVDLVLPPLLGVLPTHLAGRLVLGASLLLPLAAVFAYNRALFGRWTLWPLASALVAFNGAFLLGLLNFLLGVAAAFALAALWTRYRERHPPATVAGTAAGVVVVFFCHISALTLLAALMFGYETDRLLSLRGRRQSTARLAAALAVFIPAILLYALSPTARASGPAIWNPLIIKLLTLLMPLMNYRLDVDVLTGCALIAFVAVAFWSRWLVVPRSTALAMAVLFVAFIVLPLRLHGATFFDVRFEIMLGYLLFAGVAEHPQLPRRVFAASSLGLLLMIAARIGLLTSIWQQQSAEVAQIRRVIAPVPPGARVLVAQVTVQDAPGFWGRAPAVRSIDGLIAANFNLAALLLIEQHAFFSTLFADPAQQPVTVQPPYRDSAQSDAEWGPPSYGVLTDKLSPENAGKYPYLAGWRSKFDFLLVMNAGGMPDTANFALETLTPLNLGEVAALYRVRPP